MSLRIALGSLALLLAAENTLAQADDVDCSKCVDASDIAGEAVTTYKIRPRAITTSRLAKDAVTTNRIADNAVTLDKLAPSVVESIQGVEQLSAEIRNTTDYARWAMSAAQGSFTTLESLIQTLELSCAEANYGKFFGCSSMTAADGTVWEFSGVDRVKGVAYLHLEDEAPGMLTPMVLAAQTNGIPGGIILAGTANLNRWTYRDPDDLSRLVDDCDSPTVAMSPKEDGGTSSRWRVNNGGYYYTEVSEEGFVPIAEADVTGQMVGVIRNINPNNVFDLNSIVWSEMTDQVTGVYSVYELSPYPFNLNEARFSQPFTIN